MTNGTIEIRVISLVEDSQYAKCPRCWNYHTVQENFMSLCDRCCKSIIEGVNDRSYDINDPDIKGIFEGIKISHKSQISKYRKGRLAERIRHKFAELV